MTLLSEGKLCIDGVLRANKPRLIKIKPIGIAVAA
jgi:hypothetical protein